MREVVLRTALGVTSCGDSFGGAETGLSASAMVAGQMSTAHPAQSTARLAIAIGCRVFLLLFLIIIETFGIG
jgi:hypothetical protein